MACDLHLYIPGKLKYYIVELKDLKEKLMDIYCELMDKTTQRYKYVA